MTKIAIVVGELSGDNLGAGLIHALKKHDDSIEFIGVGGPGMTSQGLKSLFSISELSVMGLVEVLRHLPRLLRLKKHLVTWLVDQKPDVVIGIDYPEFNLSVEKRLKSEGIKTIHYVSPSVWAWRQKRVHKIVDSVDLLLTLFPFEADFYQSYPVNVVCVGHSLRDRLSVQPQTGKARETLGIKPEGTVIGLLPGSRESEINRLLPVFLETAQELVREDSSLRFLIPAASPSLKMVIQHHLDSAGGHSDITLIDGCANDVMAASDVLLMASGTATLEALLVGRPMVVCYKLSGLTYLLLKRLVKAPWFSLPNLLAQKRIVPELIQDEVNSSNLANNIKALLENSEIAQQQLADFDTIRDSMPSGADEQAARAVISLLQQ